MSIITESIKLVSEGLNKAKDDSQKNTILMYAIIAEAKENNDLARIICNANAAEVSNLNPKIFNQFKTATADLLLSFATPANVIFGDKDSPTEDDIHSLHTSKVSTFKKKKSSELYEFYIRKCNLIKNLCLGDALTIRRISLKQRCKNIEYATYILASRFSSKG